MLRLWLYTNFPVNNNNNNNNNNIFSAYEYKSPKENPNAAPSTSSNNPQELN